MVCIAVILVIGTLAIISRQPRSVKELSFTVPWLPWLPGLSILVNVYLMMVLDYMTWVRFLVWIIIGFAVYFGYGVWHSNERPVNKLAAKRAALNDETHVIGNEDVTYSREVLTVGSG